MRVITSLFAVALAFGVGACAVPEEADTLSDVCFFIGRIAFEDIA